MPPPRSRSRDPTPAGLAGNPSGVFEPSDEDIAFFSNFGGIHIITGRPYTEATWAAWDAARRHIPLEVVP